MSPDFTRAYQLAQLACIVYDTSDAAMERSAEALGLHFVSAIEDEGFQCIVVTDPKTDEQIVDFRGTPVTCGRDINDALVALAADAGFGKTSFGSSGKVLTAPLQLVRRNFLRVTRLLDVKKPVAITGHSLGAVSALIFAALLDRTVDPFVCVFAPFQFADAAFHKAVFGGRSAWPTIFGRASDFAPGHDHADPATTLCGPIWHLVDGTCRQETTWTVYRESIGDHAVTAYADDLGKLATAASAQ
jgi:hypothetical protein